MSCSVYQWGLAGGRNSLFSVSLIFFREFGELYKICESGKISELWEIGGFRGCCLGTGYAIGHQAMRKILMCIACFAYSFLLLLLLLLLLFLCCLFKLCLSQQTSFTCFPFSSPSYGGGGVSEWVSGCVVLVASCQVKP